MSKRCKWNGVSKLEYDRLCHSICIACSFKKMSWLFFSSEKNNRTRNVTSHFSGFKTFSASLSALARSSALKKNHTQYNLRPLEHQNTLCALGVFAPLRFPTRILNTLFFRVLFSAFMLYALIIRRNQNEEEYRHKRPHD